MDRRRRWVDSDVADCLREHWGFPDAWLALRLDREVRDADDTPVLFPTRDFLSNLDPDRVTPADLLRYARGPWQSENSLHFVKERWWDEDRHGSTRRGWPRGWPRW